MSVLCIVERRHREIIIRRVPLVSVLVIGAEKTALRVVVIGTEKTALRVVWIAERRRKGVQMLTALLVFATTRGLVIIARRIIDDSL